MHIFVFSAGREACRAATIRRPIGTAWDNACSISGRAGRPAGTRFWI